MTEWEKLRSGLQYDDFDPELFTLRIKAKKLFRAYNKTDDEELDKRRKLLTDLFESIGEDVWIEPDFRCEYGKNISIGNRTYINFGCVILDCAPVTIGEDVLMGPNIGIYPVNHSIDPDERSQGGCWGKPVHIGNKVWLGGDVKILSGVSIGDGSVIGTGSVVTKSIPAGVIAAGNPCRIIRPITETDKTDYLQNKENFHD